MVGCPSVETVGGESVGALEQSKAVPWHHKVRIPFHDAYGAYGGKMGKR
jgi:hypothetical protein